MCKFRIEEFVRKTEAYCFCLVYDCTGLSYPVLPGGGQGLWIVQQPKQSK